MRISDWSSDVCSSDLLEAALVADAPHRRRRHRNDESFPDRLQAAVKLADDRAGRQPGGQAVLEGREAGEDHAGVGGVGEGGAGEAVERWEARRVGEECGSTCRYRCATYH